MDSGTAVAGMPIDPQVQKILERVAAAGSPEYWQMTPQEARKWHDKKATFFDVAEAEMESVLELSCPGPGGEIPLRLYRPHSHPATLPTVLWFHGGGYVVGSLDSYDRVCRELARQSGCLVLSVAYRLAP